MERGSALPRTHDVHDETAFVVEQSAAGHLSAGDAGASKAPVFPVVVEAPDLARPVDEPHAERGGFCFVGDAEMGADEQARIFAAALASSLARSGVKGATGTVDGGSPAGSPGVRGGAPVVSPASAAEDGTLPAAPRATTDRLRLFHALHAAASYFGEAQRALRDAAENEAAGRYAVIPSLLQRAARSSKHAHDFTKRARRALSAVQTGEGR
jgi:hypothetical protein